LPLADLPLSPARRTQKGRDLGRLVLRAWSKPGIARRLLRQARRANQLGGIPQAIFARDEGSAGTNRRIGEAGRGRKNDHIVMFIRLHGRSTLPSLALETID